MSIKSRPLMWLAAGAVIGLMFALSTKDPYRGAIAFVLMGLVMAATYLYDWARASGRLAL